MNTPLKIAGVLTMLVGLNIGCGGGIIVYEAPPMEREELVTNSPGGDHMWITGYWIWHQERRWEWRAGHWEKRPYERAVWERGKWVQREGKNEWEWQEGRWVWGLE